MTVTFCGHGDISPSPELRRLLTEAVEELIIEGATEFLLGGYGAFDNMAAGVVRELKEKHPQIHACLVLAYLDRRVDATGYDSTVYPPLESVPKKYAIVHRNRWMVESADVVVACVDHGWGGAAATLRHAVTKKKRIIQLGAYPL